MLIKKGYNVNTQDDEHSIAVVAFTSREAKKLGFTKLDCDWVDVRVRQAKNADVEDIPIGIINDNILAWRRGIFDWIDNYDETTCDECHNDIALERIGRKILCEKCYEKAQ